MGKYSLSIFLDAIMASAWEGGHTFNKEGIIMETTVDSSTSLLFTFAHSKGGKVGLQECPSEIRAHSKQGAAVNISDKTLLLPRGTVSSDHQILQWVLPSVQQSQETWHQRRPPLPARYKSTLLHKDTRFFAQAGIVLQEGETSLLLKGRDCLYIGRHPKTR